MQQILRGLKSHDKIEDLDLSKTGIGSDIVCMQLLGELIQTNDNVAIEKLFKKFIKDHEDNSMILYEYIRWLYQSVWQ